MTESPLRPRSKRLFHSTYKQVRPFAREGQPRLLAKLRCLVAMGAAARTICIVIGINFLTAGSFTISAGSLKLNGRGHSVAAAKYIGDALTRRRDNVVVWFETDTTTKKSLWEDVAVQVAKRGYNCNTLCGSAAVPYHGVGVKGLKAGVHALLICTRQAFLPGNSSQPQLCCAARGKPNKAVVFQTVTVRVHADDVDLMIIGAGFDTHDAHKEEQVEELVKYVRHYQKVAQQNNRLFQAILLGDLNDRLVLKTDRLEMQWARRGGWRVGMLSEGGRASLRQMLTTAAGRRELLSWHVGSFDGVAAGGVTVTPSTGHISKHFVLQTEWWQQAGVAPEPVSYKYTPWEQLVPKDVVKSVLRGAFTNRSAKHGLVVSAAELSQALQQAGQSEECIDPQCMRAFFGMKDHIPKLKPVQEAKGAQAYLNYNRDRAPIYLSFGWLDSIGFMRDSDVSGEFLEFTTDFGVRASDHALTYARIKINTNRPSSIGYMPAVCAMTTLATSGVLACRRRRRR